MLDVIASLLTILIASFVQRRLQGGSSPSSSPSPVESILAHPGFEAVGGYRFAKTEMRRAIVLPFRKQHIFFDPSAPSLRPPSGVLISGPPGTGKTLLAKACAKESGATFLPLNPASLESKWYGDTPRILASSFRAARRRAPSILFFDEIDGMGRARGEEEQGCTYTFKCELLRHMDETAKASLPVVVLACTNHPRRLDPALRRRFQRHIEMGPPDGDARAHIFSVLCETEGISASLLASLVQRTEGWTGSDIASAHAEATAHRFWRKERLAANCASGAEFLSSAGPLLWRDWAASGRLTSETPTGANAARTPT